MDSTKEDPSTAARMWVIWSVCGAFTRALKGLEDAKSVANAEAANRIFEERYNVFEGPYLSSLTPVVYKKLDRFVEYFQFIASIVDYFTVEYFEKRVVGCQAPASGELKTSLTALVDKAKVAILSLETNGFSPSNYLLLMQWLCRVLVVIRLRVDLKRIKPPVHPGPPESGFRFRVCSELMSESTRGEVPANRGDFYSFWAGSLMKLSELRVLDKLVGADFVKDDAAFWLAVGRDFPCWMPQVPGCSMHDFIAGDDGLEESVGAIRRDLYCGFPFHITARYTRGLSECTQEVMEALREVVASGNHLFFPPKVSEGEPYAGAGARAKRPGSG